jgi:hypothetical protein
MHSQILGGIPFTLVQGVEQGRTIHTLRKLEKRHEIRRVLRGVYVDSSTPDDLMTRAAAGASPALLRVRAATRG